MVEARVDRDVRPDRPMLRGGWRPSRREREQLEHSAGRRAVEEVDAPRMTTTTTGRTTTTIPAAGGGVSRETESITSRSQLGSGPGRHLRLREEA